MASFNSIVCTTNLGNTGFGECNLTPKNIKGMILVPKTFRIVAGDLATLQTTLTTACQNASKSLRIFPVHNFDGITDNSEDDVYQTTGYGDQNFSREGTYDWMFTYSEGAKCLHDALRTRPVKGQYAIFYDADNVLYGWDLEGAMGGIPLSIFKAQKLKINDGTNSTIFQLKVMFDAVYLNEDSMYYKADFLINELNGLKDVEVYEQAAQTVVGTFNIGVRLACSKTNLYDLYSTELADASLWTATDEDGNAIAITSITANPATEAFTIVLDTNDADYPANGQPVTFDLVAPITLNTAGVENVECSTSVDSNVTSTQLATPVVAISTITSTAGTGDWAAITNAVTYETQISTNADFSTPTASTVAAPTSLKAFTGLTTATTYYVRVRAVGAGYVTSAWGTSAFITA